MDPLHLDLVELGDAGEDGAQRRVVRCQLRYGGDRRLEPGRHRTGECGGGVLAAPLDREVGGQVAMHLGQRLAEPGRLGGEVAAGGRGVHLGLAEQVADRGQRHVPAVRRGAQAGVLIKNAEALERLEKVDTLVLDKTGTLTEGKPKVVAIEAAEGFHEDDLLRLAASVERSSEHPLADAIVATAKQRNLALGEVRDFDAPAGKGVTGNIEDKSVLVGSASFLQSHGVAVEDMQARAEELRADGATVINIAIDGRQAGLFAIADPVKPSTPDALKALAEEGIKVIMLTGDNRTTANAVARRLGIADVEADVLPEQKSAVVARLQKEGRVVAMAGDGVNDAPALATADVGIAMGTGTDVAMESAAVTLLGGDLGGIVRARRLSEATMRNIRQNLMFAFLYNGAGIPIAAGVLYPALGLLLSPIVAAAAMALSSVSVVGNALRLRVTRL